MSRMALGVFPNIDYSFPIFSLEEEDCGAGADNQCFLTSANAATNSNTGRCQVASCGSAPVQSGSGLQCILRPDETCEQVRCKPDGNGVLRWEVGDGQSCGS